VTKRGLRPGRRAAGSRIEMHSSRSPGLYTFADASLTQITSGSTAALSPSWSRVTCAGASGGPPAQLGVRPGILQYTSRVLRPGLRLNSVSYKGFAITARTFQIRGSGRWTLDLLIGRRRGLRAFSGPGTYATEESAIAGCCEFGRRIIDGRVWSCSVDDLS
jgi:hypothetical protein